MCCTLLDQNIVQIQRDVGAIRQNNTTFAGHAEGILISGLSRGRRGCGGKRFHFRTVAEITAAQREAVQRNGNAITGNVEHTVLAAIRIYGLQIGKSVRLHRDLNVFAGVIDDFD